MILNPIEAVCVYVVQPIIDLLAYLQNDVHYVAYLGGLAVLGMCLGLLFSIITVLWYRSLHPEEFAKVEKGE
ncbi:uncharacterized protein [Drosophila bipectinata]|uniref:uncharacterized protein n=1 Tax=Drosophila bipectinata TaxID=42026 RepID=UPI0007E802D4|nr:uncharacterized protein LOC108125455 [Drosophila bipectinata]